MCDCANTEQFWRQVDEAHMRALVTKAISAAKAQVAYVRALATAKRATVLLGPGASREYEVQAEMHQRTRDVELRNTKHALGQFATGIDESDKQRITGSISAGTLKDFMALVRQSIVLTLLHEDLGPEDTQKAVSALDRIQGTVAGLTSWQGMVDYLNHHLDELQTQPVPESVSLGCLFLLLLTSVLIVLDFVAIFRCLLSTDPECVSQVLWGLVDQICAGH